MRLAAAPHARARTPCELAEEIPHAVEEAWLRRCGLIARRFRWDRLRGWERLRLRGRGVYVSAKHNRRTQAHFAHKENRLGVWLRRGVRRIRIKTERWH